MLKEKEIPMLKLKPELINLNMKDSIISMLLLPINVSNVMLDVKIVMEQIKTVLKLNNIGEESLKLTKKPKTIKMLILNNVVLIIV